MYFGILLPFLGGDRYYFVFTARHTVIGNMLIFPQSHGHSYFDSSTIIIIRHGYKSKKIPAATYVRDYFINFTKSPKKLKNTSFSVIATGLKFYSSNFPYDQGQ